MAKDIDLAHAIGLKPEKVIEYFKSRGFETSFNWQDVWQESHAKAFTVAKAMKLDVLKDIHSELAKSLEEGQTYKEFARYLTPRLQAKGWWGRQDVVNPTGEVENVQLGSPRRLKTIYRTNMDMAYAAGNWREMVENADDRPWWQWECVLDASTRPDHRAFHGKVWHFDDPFWDQFYPPIDWGCRCTVRALTGDQVHEAGLKGEKSKGNILDTDALVSEKTGETRPTKAYLVKKGNSEVRVEIGAGFASNPGAAWALDELAWEKAKTLPEPIRYRFINDMATSSLRQGPFEKWVDKVLSTELTKNELQVIGWMAPEEYAWLEKRGIKPPSPILAVNDKKVRRTRRESKLKKKMVSSVDDVKAIPEIIRNPIAVLGDTKNNTVVYVSNVADGDRKIKLIVHADWQEVDRNINLIKSTGRVPVKNLQDLELIRGNLNFDE